MTPAAAKYRKAARMIAEGEESLCCDALFAVRLDDYEFWFIFKATSKECILYDGHSTCWFGASGSSENQLARSLALLFMAEMASDQL